MTTQTRAEVEHTIGPAGELSIEFASGDVRIRGGSGGTARIRDLDGRDLADRFTIETTDGSLRLREKDALLGLRINRPSSAQLEVTAPAGARITIETASADIRAENLSGQQRYRTASGELTVQGCTGRIRVDTVSGDAALGLDGDVDLEARLVSGDLSIRGERIGSFVVQTTSGDLSVTGSLPGPGPYSIRTVSGDSRIVTSDDLLVDIATVTGSVGTSLPHLRRPESGRTILDIGNGGTPLSFQSISGDLLIEEAVASQPGSPAGVVAPAFEGGPASPQLVTQPAAEDDATDERLAILRDVEAGRIDVEEATARLGLLDGER